jgi:hypothetical protein
MVNPTVSFFLNLVRLLFCAIYNKKCRIRYLTFDSNIA